jgi:hypothetical protein
MHKVQPLAPKCQCLQNGRASGVAYDEYVTPVFQHVSFFCLADLAEEIQDDGDDGQGHEGQEQGLKRGRSASAPEPGQLAKKAKQRSLQQLFPSKMSASDKEWAAKRLLFAAIMSAWSHNSLGSEAFASFLAVLRPDFVVPSPHQYVFF